MRRLFAMLLGVLMATTSFASDPVPGQVADLDWMVGYWAGPFGEEVLEEHWMQPSADSVVGSVRITDDGRTRMMEFIAIEQVDETLQFRVRQWLPGMAPVQDEAQLMTLKDIGDNFVEFESGGGFVFRTLRYSRPESDLFLIEAELATGGPVRIELRPR